VLIHGFRVISGFVPAVPAHRRVFRAPVRGRTDCGGVLSFPSLSARSGPPFAALSRILPFTLLCSVARHFLIGCLDSDLRTIPGPYFSHKGGAAFVRRG